MRLRVIFNPRAGFGRAARMRRTLDSAFASRGVAVEFAVTSGPGHAAELARQAGQDGLDGVVAAGGDGTLFEVVNGLAGLPQTLRPPLGLVPLGTGNAFARDLGLVPRTWRDAVDLICSGNVRQVDLARVGHASGAFHFINIVGCGFVVEAGRCAQRVKWLGPAAYQFGVLLALPGLSTLALEIDVDGTTYRQEACLLTISNSRYTGTDFLIAPAARVDDGLLDLMLVGPVSRRRLLQVLPSVRRGTHVAEPEVQLLRGRRISLRQPGGLALAPDGEFLGTLPATIENLPGELPMFADKLHPSLTHSNH